MTLAADRVVGALFLCLILGFAASSPCRAAEAGGARQAANDATTVSWPPTYFGSGKLEPRILEKLDEQTKLDFEETGLRDALGFLQELHGIPIMLDRVALDEIKIDDDSPVTITVTDISLRSGLKLMLRRIDPNLTYTIHNETLWITTLKANDDLVSTRCYDVSALLGKNTTIRDVAELLELNFQVESVRAAKATNPYTQPVADLQNRAAERPKWPVILPHRSWLLVRGTQAQHEAVVQVLRVLKEATDKEKQAIGTPAQPGEG